MSAELSFGEKAVMAAEEAAEVEIKPYMVNVDFSWIPMTCGIVLIVLALAAIALTWLSKDIEVRRKVTRTIFTVLWTSLFAGLSFLLSSFASQGFVTGSTPIFIAASISIGAGGVSAIFSRLRGVIDLNKRLEDKNSASSIERPESPSSFWGTIDKTSIIEEDATGIHQQHQQQAPVSSEESIRSKYSSMFAPTDENTGASNTIVTRCARAFSFIMSWLLPLASVAFVTLLCFLFIEMPSNAAFLSIPDVFLSAEIAVIAGVVAGCWFVFQRRPIGFVIPMAVAFIYGLAEYFVETFKNAAIMPSDLRSAGTGMAVAGGYDYELTTMILILGALFAVAAGAIAWMRDPLSRFLERRRYIVSERYQGKFLPKVVEQKQRRENIICIIKNAICAALSVAIGCIIASSAVSAAMDTDWEEKGLVFDYWQTHNAVDGYGLIPSFMAALQLEDLDAPEGYSKEEAQKLQDGMAELYDQYVETTPERQAATRQFDDVKPNVVLVMNESFADLSFLGGLGVDYAGPEYLRNMDAIAKGNTNVSVYGGGTCNSEFEGLMTTSLGLISGGISPYAIYDLSDVDSIPKQFKALGYDTTAIHPEFATNWGRDGVYPKIGFDEFIDKDAFGEDVERSRGHVRDSETYKKVLEVLERSDTPQFVFDLTMMGHGGYEMGMIASEDNVGYEYGDLLDDAGAAATNEYLSSVRLSDEDIQAFLTELRDLDEPTVVVFYGDHQPGFTWWFQEAFADRTNDVTYQESMYRTDYFVWSNYDIAGSTWTPNGGVGNMGADMSNSVGMVEIAGNIENDGAGNVVDVEGIETGIIAQSSLDVNGGSTGVDENTDAIGAEMWADTLGNNDSAVQTEDGIVREGGTDDGSMMFASDDMGDIVVDNIVEPAPMARNANDEQRDIINGQDGTSDTQKEAYPKIESNHVLYTGSMSPASLMPWAMTFIGAPLTDYEKANYISRWWVQSNNLYGYMDAGGWWHSPEEADSVPGNDVFETGMRIIEQCSASGVLPDGGEIIAGMQARDAKAAEEITEVARIESMENAENRDGVYEERVDENSNVLAGDSDANMTDEVRALEKRQYDDAVMVNVMRWISYLNFAELI